MEDKHSFFVDLGQPVDEFGDELPRGLLRNQPATVVKQPDPNKFGDSIHEPGTAQADGFDIANDLQLDIIIGQLHHFDGPVCCTHTAPDLAALEGWPGWRGGRQKTLSVAEDDFAVGAHIDEQPEPLVPVHSRREGAGDDIATDISAERGQDVGRRCGMDVDTEIGRANGRSDSRTENEGRDADRFGLDPQQQGHHRRVAGQRHFVDLLRLDCRLTANVGGELGECVLGEFGEPRESVGIHHRRADPGDDVAAERLLFVEHRRDRDRRSGRRIKKSGDDRGSAEVESKGVMRCRGVAGLDVDEELIDNDRRDLPVGRADHRRNAAQCMQIHIEFQVVDRGQQPFDIGNLVGQRGLSQLDISLLNGWSQDHLAADTNCRCLGPGRQRRDLDLEVGMHGRKTREPPSLLELLWVERTLVHR